MLQDDIDVLVNWSNAWQLSLNPTKCHVLHLRKPVIQGSYSISDKAIEVKPHVRDLGVTIQQDLKFGIHCSLIVNKAMITARNIMIPLRVMIVSFI